MKLLIAAKTEVDAAPSRDPDKKQSEVAAQVVDAGFAALHWSARENKIDCAKLLIEAGATVDVRAADDVTPFMLACKSGHHECAKLLKGAGADVEAANVRGGSAMVVACVMGQAETVRMLLSMRADPDAVTIALDDADQPFQCRPLVTACRYDQPTCVGLLLGAGVRAECLAIALTELEAFPSFVECTRLVRQATKRKQQATKRRGGDKPVVVVDAADIARAEAAMEALLAEESAAKPAKTKQGKSGKAAASAPAAATPTVGVTRTDTASPLSETSSSLNEVEPSPTRVILSTSFTGKAQTAAQAAAAAAAATALGATTGGKKRRKKSKANKMAAEAWVEEDDVSPPLSPGATAAEEREEEEEMEAALVAVAKATRAMSRAYAAPSGAAAARRDSKEGAEASGNMYGLVSEYQLYHGEVAKAAEEAEEEVAAAAGTRYEGAPSAEEHLSRSARNSRAQDEDDDDDNDGDGSQNGSRKSDEDDSTHDGEEVEVVEVTSDLLAAHLQVSHVSSQSDYEDELSSQQSDYDELANIVKAEKVEELDMFLHRKKFTTGAMTFFLSKIKEDGPPVNSPSFNEISTGEKKLKFAQPPSPPRVPLRQATSWTIPATPLQEEERRRRKARRQPPPPGFLPTSKYHDLERRLEEEMVAAREREKE